MANILAEMNERIKALGEHWTKYTVVGSFLLYVVGYLVLRFHLTAIGLGTDLSVIDERYLFTGARCFVYLVSTVPNLVLVALPVALAIWVMGKLVPEAARMSIRNWVMNPMRLALFGILFSVVIIQFVMRHCFLLNNMLLAPRLPMEPSWLVKLLLDDQYMPIYFSLLVAMCALPLAILWALRATDTPVSVIYARGLLTFLVGVQVLLLPINYGILIVDKVMPRVATIGATPVAAGNDVWLVWEGNEGVTFLVSSRELKHRTLVTLPRTEVKRIEIIGFDPIIPKLFNDDRRTVR